MVADKHKLTPVLVGIHLVALPMYTRLPPYILFLMISFTVWALLISMARTRQPISIIRIFLAITVIISLLISYGSIFGQEPGTAMLLLLCFLKLFEMKNKRDVLLVIFIGYFLIATHFFHSQSPWIAVYVFIVVLYLTSLLIVFSDRTSSTSFKTRIKISGRMVLQAVPLMLVLFFLFPRIPGPLWSFPDDAKLSKSGVGDEMSPGSINDLISSGSVAFRVQFKGQSPDNKHLYWRGLVLSHYDGRTWTRDDAPIEARPAIVYINEDAVISEYTVMLEPHGRKWLYSLETLVAKEGPFNVTRELQVIAENEVKSVLQYTMKSNMFVTNNGLSAAEKRKNLLLPEGFNKQTISLAKKLHLKVKHDAVSYVSSVLDYFREQPFHYTLSPPLLGVNAMDEFMFNSQQGFCEHYASAFVYLMRAAGIPARVIVGYQGGTFNPIDDYMIVRQSDAHAWTEVWLDEKGWVRVDPTSAVSPERIDRGVANAGLDEARLPSFIVSNNDFLIKLGYTLDSFNHSWNKWVIGFNDKKQQELFASLGIENIDKATLFSWMVIAMTLSGVLVALWVFKHGDRKNKRDAAVYYYGLFCHKFEKAGLIKSNSESASDFLQRIVQTFPASKQKAGLITRYYQQIRYGGDDSDNRKKQLIEAVKLFKIK